jgi:hypothetical protein
MQECRDKLERLSGANALGMKSQHLCESDWGGVI